MILVAVAVPLRVTVGSAANLERYHILISVPFTTDENRSKAGP
jgi:hypothetical protein